RIGRSVAWLASAPPRPGDRAALNALSKALRPPKFQASGEQLDSSHRPSALSSERPVVRAMYSARAVPAVRAVTHALGTGRSARKQAQAGDGQRFWRAMHAANRWKATRVRFRFEIEQQGAHRHPLPLRQYPSQRGAPQRRFSLSERGIRVQRDDGDLVLALEQRGSAVKGEHARPLQQVPPFLGPNVEDQAFVA